MTFEEIRGYEPINNTNNTKIENLVESITKMVGTVVQF